MLRFAAFISICSTVYGALKCPIVACTETLEENECYYYNGADGGDAIIRFNECDGGKSCDYYDVDTQSLMQPYDDATPLLTERRKTSYCME